jgi:hypothetical protein
MFNNDPENARIDRLRIIAVKARSIHCSSQWKELQKTIA